MDPKEDPKELLKRIDQNTSQFLETVREARKEAGGQVQDDSPEPHLPRPPAAEPNANQGGLPAVSPESGNTSEPPAPTRKERGFWTTFLGLHDE